MAGHSKWANIKHRKGAQDAKRGKIFTKLIREITVAAKMSTDPNNPRLRAAVDKALGQNMTRDTIDRAIKRGQGGDNDQQLEQIRYEGYGPDGVAIIVDCLSDNRNRTVSEVRHAFSKMGGNLGTEGSVAYLFDKIGQIYFAKTYDGEKLFEALIEAGGQDLIEEDESFLVTTTAEDYSLVKDALTRLGFDALNSQINYVASVQISLTTKEQAEQFLKLFDMLEDLDDVQEVYSNAHITEEILKLL